MTERLDPLTLPLWGSRLIEASAGTGKTWTIAALYLRFVLGHGEDGAAFPGPLTPPQILVMTFTRAATRELSDRIRSRLVEAAACFRGARAVEPDDALLQALIDASADRDARERAAWRLAMAAEGMDDAAVFTIDAWVQRMLREHAFDSGCLFDEAVQPDEAAMLGEAARDYWRQQVYPLAAQALDAVLSVWPNVQALVDDATNLKRYVEQVDAAEDSLGELWRRLDTDRSRVLEDLKRGWPERVAQMRVWIREQLASKDKPFTGNALQGKRVEGWLDELDRWARTPDAAALPMTPAARHRLSTDGLREALKPGRDIDIPTLFDAMPHLVASLDALIEPAHAMRRHAAARIASRLRVLKQRAGAYGFDDMLERLERALHGPQGDRLGARIVAQYPVAMIDEFQDTSSPQYRVFERLYRPADNDPSTALLLIGDPKQSIYGFRGADIRSYLRARVAMADRHYFLGTNFRSTGALVTAINRLFTTGEALGPGAFRFGPSPGSGRAVPFVPVDARGRRDVLVDRRGPVAALTLCHDPELDAKPVVLRHFAGRCAEHIVASLDDPQCGFADPVDGFVRLKPADLVVLVRDRHEAAAVRHALRLRRVPSVYLSDQDSVFASGEAADLLHWLRAVADPADSRRARVAFATALVGLPHEDLARLSHDDVAFERRLDDLKTLHDTWRRQGVLPMLRRTLHVLDLPALWLRDAEGERRLTNVLHLAELLQAASAKLDGEQAVIRWLVERLGEPRVGADDQVVRLESDADLVRVVTIHMAKGLEYPVVYVPYACSVREARWKTGEVAILPGAHGDRELVFDVTADVKQRALLESQQEDVRLLYVALTRARHALWLGVAAQKTGRTCAFDQSAFGYLLSDGAAVSEAQIETRLDAVFGSLAAVERVATHGPADVTRLRTTTALPALADAPDYAATFERDWSIGSFSAFVRDLPRVPIAAAMLDPAVEEEVLSGPVGEDAAAASTSRSTTPRHRFPRGALAGNFLHDQLEWLAIQRFALTTDPDLREQLSRRCERQGWASRAHDVVVWMSEVVETVLPPIDRSLDRLRTLLPEMEFWFPSDGLAARQIDVVCRRHLLHDRERPPLPERSLRGMLMGFADLVFEVDGRYWVLDYKSNALGAGDDDYTHDALERSMAAHRYDVQAAIYLVALHRLLRQRLGTRYDPALHLGGALYFFIRGIRGPAAGCYAIEPRTGWLDAIDAALTRAGATA